MATLWQILKPEDKRKLAKYYRKRGYGFLIPPSNKKPIQIKTKLESPEEIDKIMRQKPNPMRRE